jgi:hypothetical protein
MQRHKSAYRNWLGTALFVFAVSAAVQAAPSVPHTGDHNWGQGEYVTWSFGNSGVDLTGAAGDVPNSSSAWSDFGTASQVTAAQNEVRAAFDEWQSVINAGATSSLTFQESSDSGASWTTTGAPDIRVFVVPFNEAGDSGGNSDPPEWVGGIGWYPAPLDTNPEGGTILIDLNDYWEVGNDSGAGSSPDFGVQGAGSDDGPSSGNWLDEGDSGGSYYGGDFYALVVHELGHALGLDHAIDGAESESIMRPDISAYSAYSADPAYSNRMPYDKGSGTGGVILSSYTQSSVQDLYGGSYSGYGGSGVGTTPEPSVLAIMLLGLGGCLLRRRRRRAGGEAA